MSTITTIPAITEFSDATPGLWNSRLSTIEDNLNALNTVGPSAISGSQATIGNTLSVDTIIEYTSANGVDVDGVLLKDSGVSASDLSASHITASDITSSALSVSGAAYADTVNEYTAAAGVTIDGVLLKDSGVSASDLSASHITVSDATASALSVSGVAYADTINEYTAAAGVKIEGVLLKDSDIVFVTSNGVYCTTGDGQVGISGGISLDSGANLIMYGATHATLASDYRFRVGSTAVLHYDHSGTNWIFADGASMEIDTINEATAAAGVTIDSVLLKDSDVSASEVVLSGQTIAVRGTHTPASGTDSGETGDITWDEDFLYVCRSTDSWVRVALSAF